MIYDYQFIKVRIEKGVFKLTLNRPEQLNSIIMPMAEEIQRALDDANTHPNVRALLITGEGKGFCAGQDLKEVLDSQDLKIDEIVRSTYNPIVTNIREIPKPVICAVNGVAAGAGASLAFVCDVTLAAQSTNFILAFSKISLIPDSGATYFLPRILGMQKAMALAMLAEPFSANKAVEMGLIYQVVPDNELIEKSELLAIRLATLPTRALGLCKKAFNASWGNSLDDQLEMEAYLQAEAALSADHREGVMAFLEKRNPHFTGL